MKKVFYSLPMFPFTSGTLHFGHFRNYILSDIIHKYNKQSHPNSHQIHPIGFDSFGLPTENASNLLNIPPSQFTLQNISTMTLDLKQMNIDFNWDRLIITSSPSYYKFTQLLFLKLYNKGLAYQKHAFVNYDPIDNTVLANEQVINGRAERSGAKVSRKLLHQWFFKITHYQQQLFDDLSNLNWPKHVIDSQRNWIGKINGCEFSLEFRHAHSLLSLGSHPVFKSDIDDLNQIKHVVIGANHCLVNPDWISNSPEILNYDKLKVPLQVRNPLYENKWIDVHVTHKYETQAILECVPINSGKKFTNLEHLPHPQPQRATFYKLKDWLISRQRKWGTPIPIINCPNCGVVPVPEQDLPVLLSDNMCTKCPTCNSDAVRESDTMDTFVDSSWYWARFCDPYNDHEMLSLEKAKEYLPVDVYIGGAEHSILHLLYSRFICKFLNDENIITVHEPFTKLITQGMVLGKTFKDKDEKYYMNSQVKKVGDNKFETIEGNIEVKMSWEKMSKSKLNGINAMELIKEYGSDVVRLYMLSRVNVKNDLKWDKVGIKGMSRWLGRMDKIVEDIRLIDCVDSIDENDALWIECKKVMSSVEGCIGSDGDLGLNVLISDVMKLSVRIQGHVDVKLKKECMLVLIKRVMSILAPEWSSKALIRMGV